LTTTPLLPRCLGHRLDEENDENAADANTDAIGYVWVGDAAEGTRDPSHRQTHPRILPNFSAGIKL
jgi:hypothetical protein